ncbi:uncharacterized protein PAC_02456 [Phialocephala subalpina]|uniref:Uncharacterized protein n=1 Tax=Phialocephala subalpina TaxID=576137 RepID=A0A1L7WIJ0_9HELO|nr:uncharacterized protein PAC_02456 [Phialocephala subalpina]
MADEQGNRAPERFCLSTKHGTLLIPSDFLYHGLFDSHFIPNVANHLCHLATERRHAYDLKRKFFTLIHKSFPNPETLRFYLLTRRRI